jgi:hypothetical protein
MGLKYIQKKDGEAIRVKYKEEGHRIACCDCGLTHDFTFQIKGDYLLIKATRNNRATAQRRNNYKKYGIRSIAYEKIS